MSRLIAAKPDGIQTTGRTTYFYYGVNPLELHNLPVGAEFTCVFSPYGFEPNWESVRFVVTKTGSQVKAKRTLEPHEIEHFQQLLEQVSKDAQKSG